MASEIVTVQIASDESGVSLPEKVTVVATAAAGPAGPGRATDATPQPTDLAGAVGTSEDLARADHVHRVPALAFKPIGTPVFWDSFDRPDGELGVADSGHTWVDATVDTTWDYDRPRHIEIKAGRAVVVNPIGAATAWATVSDPAFALDYTNGEAFVVDAVAAGDGSFLPLGVVLRYVDADNWLAVGLSKSSRWLYLRECRAGTITDLATDPVQGYIAARLPISFRCFVAHTKEAYGDGYGVHATVMGGEPGDPAYLYYKYPYGDGTTWEDNLMASDTFGIGGGGGVWGPMAAGKLLTWRAED